MIKRFNRYELKYILPVKQRAALVDTILQFAKPDPYSGLDGYPLVSLYYDSPGLDFFWAKIEGIKYRRKLRIRIYPDTPITRTRDAMVEIKQRINRTVQKRRLKLPLDDAERLCMTGYLNEASVDTTDMAVANEIKYMSEAMQLRPTCITAYRRQAFIGGPFEPGLRITFDTSVRYRVHDLKVNQEATNHLIIPNDFCIMEVKANNAVPDWVTSMISRNNCELRRISKYCAGIARASDPQLMSLAMTPGDYLSTTT